jgi:hypothetical protein
MNRLVPMAAHSSIAMIAWEIRMHVHTRLGTLKAEAVLLVHLIGLLQKARLYKHPKCLYNHLREHRL